jgi:glutathione S-transferase
VDARARLGYGDRAMIRALDVATSFATSTARLGLGMAIGTLGPRPQQPIELYDFEACPYCRKVREAMSILDLEADVKPCPKGGTRFRDEVVRRGGRAQFPFIVDPNTKVELYESDDIVRYLFDTYGTGDVPMLMNLPLVPVVSSALSFALRLGSGTWRRAARPAAHPLELWSFEASPFCRIVRETLTSLELPYRLHNVAKGSPSRDAFVRRSGKMQVPYLVDPNTGAAMFESADIVRYLDETYALP